MAKKNDKQYTATYGGCSFEQLCNKECNYVCDRECLVEVTQQDTLLEADDKLITNIDRLFQVFQTRRGKEITMFYIGKTYVRWNKKYKRNVAPLDPLTWNKTGISKRWGKHKENIYGKGGMIVIAVITRDQVPTTAASKVNQELYTLALEQRLLHYYQITKGDKRLQNDTFTSGRSDMEDSAGYALYVVFSLSEDGEERNIHEQENDEVTDSVDDEQTTSHKTSNITEVSTNAQDRCTDDDDIAWMSPPMLKKTKGCPGNTTP